MVSKYDFTGCFLQEQKAGEACGPSTVEAGWDLTPAVYFEHLAANVIGPW
jgi:hypothetical protein